MMTYNNIVYDIVYQYRVQLYDIVSDIVYDFKMLIPIFKFFAGCWQPEK